MKGSVDMQAVYKYPVEIADYVYLELPEEAEILTVQVQGGNVFLWALVNPDAPSQERILRIAGTGHPIIESEDLRYISTFQLHGGQLIFHAFQLLQRVFK
jgi:hypothetical protein